MDAVVNPTQWPDHNWFNGKTSGRIIGWMSGGVASAMACKLAIDHYGDQVVLVFCDTRAEDPDTNRFLSDMENALGKPILRIGSDRFHDPEAVWYHFNGLNFANGAPCSSYLKREVRVGFQDIDNDFGQIFGFDDCPKERRRAVRMGLNYPEINPIFPLIAERVGREDVFYMCAEMGVEPPRSYQHFSNNNCIGDFASPKGGCVQGGIGYWQHIAKVFPHKYERMAAIEHDLSNRKGEPVTICRSGEAPRGIGYS